MSVAPPRASEWARRAERGSLPLLRFMVWLSLALGRRATRLLLPPTAAYFLAFAGPARRASGAFLARCLGRAPTLGERYRTFATFATTVHDRVYFLKDRFDLFDIRVHGEEHFEPNGMLLMGAHLGSFEAMRACGRGIGQRRIAMAMYEATAQRISGVLAALAPEARADIVALGKMESMLELSRRLDEGALVGILADRTFDDSTVPVPFMGEPAPFPPGPMRMAAALRRRVLFITGLHRGGNRYDIHIEPIADFTALDSMPRVERDALVQAAIVAYAGRLEHYARLAPDNWFNFHDFWKRAP